MYRELVIHFIRQGEFAQCQLDPVEMINGTEFYRVISLFRSVVLLLFSYFVGGGVKLFVLRT